MDFSDALKELKNKNKVRRASKSLSNWLEISFGKIIVAGRRGPFVEYVPTQKDILADDWELVTDTKLTKVVYVKEIIFTAECPRCLALNTIKKEDIDSKDDKILACVKCGYEFGIRKSSETDVIV